MGATKNLNKDSNPISTTKELNIDELYPPVKYDDDGSYTIEYRKWLASRKNIYLQLDYYYNKYND